MVAIRILAREAVVQEEKRSPALHVPRLTLAVREMTKTRRFLKTYLVAREMREEIKEVGAVVLIKRAARRMINKATATQIKINKEMTLSQTLN